MKIMKQSGKILLPESPTRHIERIGRICYKSEDKITDGTDKKFVEKMFNNKHHAMLEHYRFIMQVRPDIYDWLSKIAPRHMEFSSYNDRLLISFNARAIKNLKEDCRVQMFGILPMAVGDIADELIGHIIREYGCYELFGYGEDPHIMLSTAVNFINNSPAEMCQGEWNIHGWFSAHMITDRGITHEIVRHREETSFAQESTRYCDYSKNKHDRQITVIDQGFSDDSEERNVWLMQMKNCETAYLKLIDAGISPQFARSVLPTCLKTEIVMTAPIYEWCHFFNLRMRGTTGAPHPLIKELATMVYEDMMNVLYGI